MKQKLTKLQRLNNQDADGNFLNLEPQKSKEIVVSRETFNGIREQIQEDLICLIEVNDVLEFIVEKACQIVVDSFKKLDLTN
jgi:hypothetical protein